MGLGSRKGGGKNYLSTYGGSIVKEWRKSKPSEDQVPEGKEVLERTISMGKNSGNTVWYVEFDYLTGPISKIVLDDSGDWGDVIEIYINDVGEEFVLQLNADSSYGKDFLKKLENIDFSQDVCFAPWSMTPEEWFDLTGKKTNAASKSGLTIRVGDIDGEKVESFYSKEDPKGLPELVEKKTRKGSTWDGTEQLDFLLDRLEAVIEEKFGVSNSNDTTSENTTADASDTPNKPKTKPKKKAGLPF